MYSKQVQKYLQKKYLSVLLPEKHLEKMDKEKNYDKKRNQTLARKEMFKRRDQNPDRKDMHQKIDKVRDQNPERIAMHQEIDKKRNKTSKRKAEQIIIDIRRDQNPERKEMHKELDKQRDKNPERKDMHKELDRRRDKNTERIEMHQEIDRNRNKTLKRKAEQAIIDKRRDQTPKRRKMHKDIDKIRDQNPERIYYKKAKKIPRHQQILIDKLQTDTGFDIICSSCLQYKSSEYCKPISILNQQDKNKYIVKYCGLLRNRTEGQFVCNICLKDINRNKFPQRSNKNRFKFANFPNYLIRKLKKICQVRQKDILSTCSDEDSNDREALKLNKLESYLLKLVIPFIRIIHCSRGSYFKVKGDLILISSDLRHSLSKILPVDQSLIPVCFKRKLAYTGSYIEEFIERQKNKNILFLV